MKRDEVPGPAVPAPEAALPGGTEAGEADGEGGAVTTAVRGTSGSGSAADEPGDPGPADRADDAAVRDEGRADDPAGTPDTTDGAAGVPDTTDLTDVATEAAPGSTEAGAETIDEPDDRGPVGGPAGADDLFRGTGGSDDATRTSLIALTPLTLPARPEPAAADEPDGAGVEERTDESTDESAGESTDGGADDATGLVPTVTASTLGRPPLPADDDPVTSVQPVVGADALDTSAVPVTLPATGGTGADGIDGAGDTGAGPDDEATRLVTIAPGDLGTDGADGGSAAEPADQDADDASTDDARSDGEDPDDARADGEDPDDDDADAEGEDADGAGADTVAAAGGGPRATFDEVTGTYVVQDGPAEMSPSELRVDFGAHLEANYQRLVAQLYAITLSADQAHSVVQDAYSRAWRNWSIIGRSADPTGWVRRVAVRTTMRSWRHLLARFGLVRSTPPVAEGLDERTTQLLTALRQMSAPERRSVVLFHMAGLSTTEIASVEQVSPTTISTRLDRARRTVLGDGGDLLTGVLELPGVPLADDRGYVDQMTMPPADDEPGPPGAAAAHLDDRWERAGSWTGGPDGSWPVSEAPPWEAPNSDPWPPQDGSTGRIATDHVDQITTDVHRNDLPDSRDDRAWGGVPPRDGGVLFDEYDDEYDTVAPDGTVVAKAEGRRAADDEGPAGAGVRPGDGATGTEYRTEGDSEDRR